MAPPLKPQTPLGERLIQARGAMQRNEAAAALKTHLVTLGSYERGVAVPPADVLISMKAVYGISIDWLLTGEGEMRPAVQITQATDGNAHGLDKPRLRATLVGFCDAIRRQPGILDMTPDELTDFFMRGYDWLGSATTSEKAEMANSVKGMTDRKAG